MSSMYAASNSLRLHFPVLDSQDVVVVGLNNLPDEVEELLEILAAEAAPLSVWFDFAKAYLSQGKEEQFKQISQEAIRDEVTEEVTRFFGQRPTYEQTQFHCALAALYMGKASQEKDVAKKAELFGNAAKSIQAARMMNADEQMVSIAQGMLHLAKAEMPQARQEFTRACSQLNNGKPNVVGLLALAGLFFRQQQYKDALLLYRRALAQNPGCPAEVRLGIAACHFRLGDLASAGAAFERVVQLDPNNPDALMGLAVIKFSSPNSQQGLADGLPLLRRAFELDAGNVGTLILLAHFCLLRGEYRKVSVLARSALEVADTNAVKAEAHCLMARAAHAQQQWNTAATEYHAAAQLDPAAALPHLGMAQMFVRRGLLVNASTELEIALKSQPAMFDALKILGQLIGDDPTKVSKVLTHLKAAAGRAEDDPDMWELLAELSAVTGDHAASLNAYKKVLAIHRSRQQTASQQAEQQAADGVMDGLFGDNDMTPKYTIPARVLNNAAVLLFRGGDLQQASTLMAEAQAAAGTAEGSEQLSGPHHKVLAYNLARLREALGHLKEAEEQYQAILAQDPKFIDCMLRLACVARTKGASAQALEWAQRANQLQAGHPDALAICAQLHMDRRSFAEADAFIKKLMSVTRQDNKPAADGVASTSQQPQQVAGMRGDCYAQLAQGNLLLNSSPADRHKPADNRRAQDYLFKGLEIFRSVLRTEPRNAYAANGIGATLAELGWLDDAQEVFADVQAAVAASSGFLQIPDVYINLANVALAKQEYTTAQRLYKIAMDKLGNTKKSQVLLYLARAHYDSGDLPAAKSCLLRAVHIAPTDYKLRFNAALTMQEFAVRNLRKQRPNNDPTRLQEFQRAKAELECARRYFEHLNSLGPARTHLEPKRLLAHVEFCKDQAVKAVEHVEAARKEAEEMKLKREEMDNLRALEAKKRELDAKKKEAHEKAQKEAIEAEARRALERQERLKEEWRLQRDVQEAAEGADGERKKKKGKAGDKKRKGKTGARAMAGDDEEPSGDGEDGAGAKSEEGEEPELNDKELDKLFGGDSDDEQEQARNERELMARAGLGSDDEGVPAAGPSTAGGGRLKRVRASEGGDEGAAAGGMLQDEDEDPDAFLRDFEDPQADGEGEGAGGEEEPPQKRARRGAALADSDEEVELPPPDDLDG